MRNSSSQKGYPIAYKKHRLLDQKLHTRMNVQLCSKVVMKDFSKRQEAPKKPARNVKIHGCEQVS